jgi:hypothetical protein
MDYWWWERKSSEKLLVAAHGLWIMVVQNEKLLICIITFEVEAFGTDYAIIQYNPKQKMLHNPYQRGLTHGYLSQIYNESYSYHESFNHVMWTLSSI